MALKTYSVNITDTPTMIVANNGKVGLMEVWINNVDINNDCHIGASNVTPTNGYVLTKFTTTGVANKATMKLFSGDTLYGVCAVGKTATLGITITGVNNGTN